MVFQLLLFDNNDKQVYSEKVKERSLNALLRETKRRLDEGYVKISDTDYLNIEYIKGFRIIELEEGE